MTALILAALLGQFNKNFDRSDVIDCYKYCKSGEIFPNCCIKPKSEVKYEGPPWRRVIMKQTGGGWSGNSFPGFDIVAYHYPDGSVSGPHYEVR